MFRLAGAFKPTGAVSLRLARAPTPTGAPNLGLHVTGTFATHQGISYHLLQASVGLAAHWGLTVQLPTALY